MPVLTAGPQSTTSITHSTGVGGAAVAELATLAAPDLQRSFARQDTRPLSGALNLEATKSIGTVGTELLADVISKTAQSVHALRASLMRFASAAFSR